MFDADALPAAPFPLGVASGDPLADRVVLWTRLAVDPLDPAGRGGMGRDPIDVDWEVASDEGFADIVAAGTATASPRHGHSVHVDADGLLPDRTHWYRFRVGPWTSPVGRTRTLPAPGAEPERFTLAVTNCQWLDLGTFAAYARLVEQDDVDLVVHLGDYVYEYPGERALPARLPETVEDWRIRYAAYRLDPALRDAHARFPFVCTWDDHEVRDNYAGVTTLDPSEDPATVQAHKAAAYQAWWEHLPVRLDPPEGPVLDVHRSFDIGDLARLYLLDERQWSDEPPCRHCSDVFDGGDCPERTAIDRTKLGAHQERWLAEATASSRARWNLLGNPQVLAGIDVGTGDEPHFYLDSWDGYPHARHRLIEALRRTSNPIVLTGDYHTGMVLDVVDDPFAASAELVFPEFVAPPISSPLFTGDVSVRTPHLREQTNVHGYLVVDVSPAHVDVRFRALTDVQDPDSPITTTSTWRVDAGDPNAHRVEAPMARRGLEPT